MNMITVLIVALVLGAYFYPDCPKMLKDNKQMLLGVFVGLLGGQYLGVKIEGMMYVEKDTGTVIHKKNCDGSGAWFGIDDNDPKSPGHGELLCLDANGSTIWTYSCVKESGDDGEWVSSDDGKTYKCQ